MYWNHRVIEVVDANGEKHYGIHEVYYDNDGNPRAYTENAVGVTWSEGDSPLQVLEWMTNCLSKPFLKKSDFPESAPLDWGGEGDGELLTDEEVDEFFKRFETTDLKRSAT